MSGSKRRSPAAGKQELFRHGGEEYSIVRMPGDGNCLFHSLAFCLRRSVAEHQAIRRQAVDYVAANWSGRFGPALGAFLQDRGGRPIRTANGYSSYMARFGVFGGDPELCAISEIYGVEIKVFVKRHPKCKPHVYNEHSRSSICLLFSGSPDYGHYDVVIPLRGSSNGENSPIARRELAKDHTAIVATVDNVFFYTVAFSTLLMLCVSFFAMQLSLTSLKH